MNRFYFFASLLFFTVAPSRADTLFDNGAASLANGTEITHWREADQFTLPSAAIVANIRFWEVEASSTFEGTFLWEIRANSASNTPGALLFTGSSTNLSHFATGRRVFIIYPEFLNTFDIPPASLPAGTYWLVLHNGPYSNNTGRDIFWETATNASIDSSLSDEAPFPSVWESNGSASKLAFQLFGVPETFRPRITVFDFATDAPRITFTTVAGQNYRVEYNSSPNGDSWTTVSGAENVSGTGNPVQVIDPDPAHHNQPRGFYRAALLIGPPPPPSAAVPFSSRLPYPGYSLPTQSDYRPNSLAARSRWP